MTKQPTLRDHLRKATQNSLWDDAIKCFFAHSDLLDQDLLDRAILLNSQRINTQEQALQGHISRDLERTELSKSQQGFLGIFNHIDPETRVLPDRQIPFDQFELDISLEQLRIKLRHYLHSFGILPTLELLLEIVQAPAAFSTLKHDFKTQQWEFSFRAGEDLRKWYATEDHYRQQLLKLIDELELSKLRGGWESTVSNWTALPHQITTTNYHLLFPEAEDIYPLIRADHTTAEANKYRRLLHLAQDAFKLGDYELSLKYCRQVQEYIEPESAQVYEFLLQAFFNHQRADQIVEEALQGDSKLLQQLFVYVGRIKSLLAKSAAPPTESAPDHARIQYAHPDIPRKKLTHIVDGLSQSLQRFGARIDFDYLLDSERNRTYLDRKREMERYLQIGVKICRFVEAKPTLVEILVNELAGGGKFDWISTNDHHQLIDNYDFPAVGTYQSLLGQLSYENGDSPKTMYALNLRNSLKQKLNRVYREYPEARDRLSPELESTLFPIVSRWLQACKVAYLLFDENRSFLELAIRDELTKADGLLDWFTFDEEGQLVSRLLPGSFLQTDVKAEYAFIVTAYAGESGWQSLEAQLIDKYYQRWLSRTDQQYAQLKTAAARRDREELRPQVAECIRRWVIAYKVSGDAAQVDKAVEELIGKGILRWFDLFDQDGRGSLEPISVDSFDPDPLLQELVELTDNYDLELAVKEIVQNLYYNYIRYGYARIEPDPLNADEKREHLLNAVQQALYCYDLYPNQEFLQLPYVELVQERKYAWFHVTGTGIDNALDPETFGVNPMDLLEKLYTYGRYVGNKYQWESISLTIAENRYRDLKKRYEEEFHFLRRKNWRLHSRIPMVEILQACVTLFRQSGEYRYLEYPDIEWVQNRGKLRWRFSLFPGLYFEHWQNHEISGFNYRREKREVKEWLRNRTVDLRPVLVKAKPF